MSQHPQPNNLLPVIFQVPTPVIIARTNRLSGRTVPFIYYLTHTVGIKSGVRNFFLPWQTEEEERSRNERRFNKMKKHTMSILMQFLLFSRQDSQQDKPTTRQTHNKTDQQQDRLTTRQSHNKRRLPIRQTGTTRQPQFKTVLYYRTDPLEVSLQEVS